MRLPLNRNLNHFAQDDDGDSGSDGENECESQGSEAEETTAERKIRKRKEDAEAKWFSAATEKMVHTVSAAQITEMKRKFYSH